jgi:sec-independent protein translocase protein TatC
MNLSEQEGMSWVDHLGELRKRIIWILIVLVLSLVIGFVLAQPVIQYLKSVEPAKEMTWHYFSPWEGVRIYVNVAFIFAIVISLPFTLYQLWSFVRPGLRVEEQKASLLFVPFAFILCLAGLAFGYFIVFPLAFYFTTIIAGSLGLTETIGAANYFSFMFNILIPLGVLFELPIVVMFLTKLRILNPRILSKFRRYAHFILFIVATLITPPDLVSAIIVAIPMSILYEFSIMLSSVVYRKQKKADAEREAAYE